MENNLTEVIEALRKRAGNEALNLAVVGPAGTGKSTLVNRVLHFDSGSPDAAREGGDGVSMTTEVKLYTKERDGAVVNVWDTPGLYDSAHVGKEKVLAQLSKRIKNRIDLVLLCVEFRGNTRIDDKYNSVVFLLTKVFSEQIWENALFVMTFANETKLVNKDKHITLQQNIKTGLRKSLKDAGVSLELASSIPFLTAGNESGTLPFETEEWNKRLFEQCLLKVNVKMQPTLLQVRYGPTIWDVLLRAVEDGKSAIKQGYGMKMVAAAEEIPSKALLTKLKKFVTTIGSGLAIAEGTYAGVVGAIEEYKEMVPIDVKKMRKAMAEEEK